MPRSRVLMVPSVLVALALIVPLAGAQEAEEEKPAPAAPETPPVITQHEIRVGGQALRYAATAGYMPLKDEEGELKANVFFIAYTKADGGDVSQRPITFAFNGGPGSSSVWLHLGAIGPKRVVMTDEGEAPPPPYELTDNESTWLEFTDLVFIDPVMTGYSRPASGEEKSQFHGVDEDVESVGEFIRLYTTRSERWSSPKFLAGESYGTTRAAGLSRYLQRRHGMYMNGLVLISAALDFQTLDFTPNNDLPYILILPTYTATAWYHQQLGDDLQARELEAVLADVRAFALEEYALALMKGADLSTEERQQIVGQLSRYTGLPEEYVEDANLRVDLGRFVKELMRDEGRTAGRLDSRFKGMDRDNAGESFEYDPSYAAIQGPFTATLNEYLREQLGYENDIAYEILSGRVRPWNWGSARDGFVSVTEDLRQAMTQNPALHVLVANGYYDMATPFFATEYVFTHLGGDPSLLDRVEMTYYPAGHMMYIQKQSLEQLTRDVQGFMTRVLSDDAAAVTQADR